MKHKPAQKLLPLLALTLLISGCASVPRPLKQHETIYIGSSNIHILGQGIASGASMKKNLIAKNPKLNPNFVDTLVNIYTEEALIEGVNHDIAFVQMCHETNYLQFGGQVLPGQNNFAGLGATDDGAQGATFDSVRRGVRAQIQHLVAYSTTRSPKTELVDPRFSRVKQRGQARTIFDLAGTWATDPLYGKKLENKLYELYSIL